MSTNEKWVCPKTYIRVATTCGGTRIESVTREKISEMHIDAIHYAKSSRGIVVEKCRYADFLMEQARLCDDRDEIYCLHCDAEQELKDVVFLCRNCSRRDRVALGSWREHALGLLRRIRDWEEEYCPWQ